MLVDVGERVLHGEGGGSFGSIVQAVGPVNLTTDHRVVRKVRRSAHQVHLKFGTSEINSTEDYIGKHTLGVFHGPLDPSAPSYGPMLKSKLSTSTHVLLFSVEMV